MGSRFEPHLTTDGLRNALARSCVRDGHRRAQVGGSEPATGKKIELSTSSLLAHAPMEPLNTTVSVTPDGCEIWAGTQVARGRKPSRQKSPGVR